MILISDYYISMNMPMSNYQFNSKDKIIKKVNKQMVELLKKCFEENKEMQIVVAYGITYNNMNWEVSCISKYAQRMQCFFKTKTKFLSTCLLALKFYTAVAVRHKYEIGKTSPNNWSSWHGLVISLIPRGAC